MARRYTMALAILSLMGCGTPPAGSETKELAFDRTATNVFLNIGAPATGKMTLAGVPVDVRETELLFKDALYGFGVTSVNEATKSQILDATRQEAAKVSENGTLMFYFTGHGMDVATAKQLADAGKGPVDGQMYTQDGQSLSFKEVADAIQSVRTSPVKRLVVVVDNCYSGLLVDSVVPGLALTAEPSGSAAADAADGWSRAFQGTTRAGGGKLYEQAMVLTAASPAQLSMDMPVEEGKESLGGLFSHSWRTTIKALRADKEATATLRDMAEETRKLTITASTAAGSLHEPQYRALPGDAVLNDKLFAVTNAADAKPGDDSGGASGNTGSTGGTTTPPATDAPVNAGIAFRNSASNDDGYFIYVYAPLDSDKLTLCKGEASTCLRVGRAPEIAFKVHKEKEDKRKVFKTLKRVRLTKGSKYTFVAYGDDGEPKYYRVIKP